MWVSSAFEPFGTVMSPQYVVCTVHEPLVVVLAVFVVDTHWPLLHISYPVKSAGYMRPAGHAEPELAGLHA
jgi:hypothetical protein